MTRDENGKTPASGSNEPLVPQGPSKPPAPPTPPTPSPAAPDPFDLTRLRLSQEFSQGQLKKLLTNIPVKKPNKTSFVQTHPDEEYRLATMVIYLKEDEERYLVAPELHADLVGETAFGPQLLVTSIARPNDGVFLWPIPLAGLDGKLNHWHASAMEAATLARGQWVRVQANKEASGYDVSTSNANLPAPKWPTVPFVELIRIAFRGRVIESLDHPVLRRLRGEL